MKLVTVFVLTAVSFVFADDFKTVNGKEYKDASVTRVEPDGLVLLTTSGISKIYFNELPKEVQQRFNFDAAKAAAYSADQAARQAALQKQKEELQHRLAESKEAATRTMLESQAKAAERKVSQPWGTALDRPAYNKNSNWNGSSTPLIGEPNFQEGGTALDRPAYNSTAVSRAEWLRARSQIESPPILTDLPRYGLTPEEEQAARENLAQRQAASDLEWLKRKEAERQLELQRLKALLKHR